MLRLIFNSARPLSAGILVRLGVLLLGVVPISAKGEAGKDDIAKLQCLPSSELGRLDCVLSVGLDGDIFVLESPFVLEGPLGEDGYVYRLVSRDRWENTLEYGFPRVEKLGGRILFKPTVYLSQEETGQLFKARAGESVSFAITLEPFEKELLEKSSRWLVRPKVVAVRESNLNALLTHEALAPDCRERVTRILGSDRAVPESVGVRFPGPGPKQGVDGCTEEISGAFEHIFSDQFLVELDAE